MAPSPTRRYALLTLVVAALSAAAPGAAAQSPASAGDDARNDTVWCLDEQRSIVRKQVRWRCEGRVVTHEEAERVKQERVDRIKRVLQRERKPLLPGRRLAGTGTGFFVSTDGLLITNNHVIDTCQAITVTPAGGSEVVATLRGRDPGRDLALLQTGQASPRAAVLRAFDEIIENEPITVVGYPLHGMVVIQPVEVSGRVHPGAQPPDDNVFAMKADIRRGNSGGPVLDEAARVIGVVFAKVDTPKVYEKTGKLVRDVGLAIRLPVVRDFLRSHSVDFVESRDGAAMDFNARITRAREFIAQIGCWR